MSKHEIVKRRQGGALAAKPDAEEAYYQRLERFRQAGIASTLALSHDIERREDGRYYLVKLSESKAVMGDDSEHKKSASSFQGGYSGSIGFDREPRRGKYNDEGRLTLTETVSVEVGEVAAFASM